MGPAPWRTTALLLFGVLLLCATLLFRQDFEQAASAGRWLASTAFLLASAAIVAAMLRAVLRRERSASRRDHLGTLGAVSGRSTAPDHAASAWRFTPRWKEELACASPGGEVVLEMMMDERHVYFPTEEAWARQAPGWAKDRRAELLAELEQWCLAQGIPLTVDEKAWVASR